MGTSSNLGGPVSHPAPCLWPGKTVSISHGKKHHSHESFTLEMLKSSHGVQCNSIVPKALALNVLGSHMGADSNPGGPVSHPAPCLWPGKAVKNGPKPWNPAPVWDTRRKFLDAGFGLAQYWPLRSLGE